LSLRSSPSFLTLINPVGPFFGPIGLACSSFFVPKNSPKFPQLFIPKNFRNMNLKAILIVALLCPVAASAQNFQFGLKLGGGSAKVNLSGSTTLQGTEVIPADAQVSFHGGAFARLGTKRFFVQPEVYFSTIGSQAIFRSTTAGQVRDEVENYRLNRIDVPVLGGLQLGKLRLMVGPVLSTSATSSTSVQDKINTATFGFQAGAGLTFGKLNLDARYEGGLSNFSDGLTVPVINRRFATDQRMTQFLVSVGYRLF
jgi:hypothetical protein